MSEKKNHQAGLFSAFFRVGILGFGGGPSSIPLVHKEVVEKYKWMDDKEFSDILALGNAMPGPIATKMAGYIGYRVGGIAGLLNALLASTLPTVAAMILLLTTLNAYKDLPWVNGMSQAVVPVVGVMLAVLTWDFVKKSTAALGWTVAGMLIGASLLLLEWFNVHPAILILAILAYALLFGNRKQKVKAPKGNGGVPR
ncbi:chromate transporter [Jeotgalibacillus proteolyticus]|uniref:Chromate transporter n=1 Tax=Jeotgalibacillus proteolyticus TaxID=2082395 RepID=A0A2S5GBD1_9BACL|nr:chromate transporter [Jeotgalibacillus proteolyticus]PPA70224.1 chromate transporter [Jeotgalibacillus proteolyticus]